MLDDQTLFLIGFMLGVLGRPDVASDLGPYFVGHVPNSGDLLLRNTKTGNCTRVAFSPAGWMPEDYYQAQLKHLEGTAYFSVESFGAKGDGVTDDTAAIQAAIDYVADSTVSPEGEE